MTTARLITDLGVTGENVASNVKALRQSMRISQADLAVRTAQLGRPLGRMAVARIETGERRVSVDDLAVLAAALGVSKSALLERMTVKVSVRIS